MINEINPINENKIAFWRWGVAHRYRGEDMVEKKNLYKTIVS